MSYSTTQPITRGTAAPPARHPAGPGSPDNDIHALQVVPARTDALLRKSFRLRYRVYCIENGFERADENPGGMETDEYDRQSAHCLLVRRPGNIPVGTARLILPASNGSGFPLPIRRVCAPSVMAQFARVVPQDRAAEISRFAIAKRHRRRSGDRHIVIGGPDGMDGTGVERAIPHVSLGLMQAVVAMAATNGMTHLYAVMEPALLRMLRLLGLYFHDLGPPVDYHGWRQPCFCDLDRLLATAYARRPDIWSVLTDDGTLWPLNAAAPSDTESR